MLTDHIPLPPAGVSDLAASFVGDGHRPSTWRIGYYPVNGSFVELGKFHDRDPWRALEEYRRRIAVANALVS